MTMSHEETRALNEVRQRVTRIESRICRIADFLGAHVGTPAKEMEIRVELENSVEIDIPVMDITFSEIIQFLAKQGKQRKVAYIYFNGMRVATMPNY